MKIRAVVAEFFYADGQTGRQADITKYFAKAPKNEAAF